MNKIKRTIIEYLISEAKCLIKYVGSNDERFSQVLNLEIDKCITFQKSLTEMQQISININLTNTIKNLDFYLIDLEYMKKNKSQCNIFDNGYIEYIINGKNKKNHIITSKYKPNIQESVDYLVEYKNKLTKFDIVGLLREIFLCIGISEDDSDDIIKKEFTISKKKGLKYKFIYADKSFLSIPLIDLESETNINVYINTKADFQDDSFPQSKISTKHRIYDNYEELVEDCFYHHIAGDYVYTEYINKYYDKLS